MQYVSYICVSKFLAKIHPFIYEPNLKSHVTFAGRVSCGFSALSSACRFLPVKEIDSNLCVACEGKLGAN